MPRGPLQDTTLRDWFGIDLAAAGRTDTTAFAGRDAPDQPDLTICYRSTHPHGRRFDVARLVGDHLVAAFPEDTLLPATRATTARQRFQRAFAAELLLPWDDLAERAGDDPDDDTMEATAQEFRVSPLLVRTRLVAKRLLPADTLDTG